MSAFNGPHLPFKVVERIKNDNSHQVPGAVLHIRGAIPSPGWVQLFGKPRLCWDLAPLFFLREVVLGRTQPVQLIETALPGAPKAQCVIPIVNQPSPALQWAWPTRNCPSLGSELWCPLLIYDDDTQLQGTGFWSPPA